ncbi:MAG: YgjV family protein [Lachnospiraceae bacterium]|nr:YgjV family protein [Lachnospiraceae bacterium]
MNTGLLIELFGYLGSVLVVISMLMTSVKRLRIVNTVGSVIFTIYALIIKTYTTAVLNACLVVINLYRLYEMEKIKRHFLMVEESTEKGVLTVLLARFEEDIRKFFPDFKKEQLSECNKAFLVLCDGQPAGVLLGKSEGEELRIRLDYSLPAYRDYSVGTFLYGELAAEGIKRLSFSEKSKDHIPYLEKMGFVKQGETYYREL